MIQFILENAQKKRNLETAFKYGKLDQYMKDSGLEIWQIVKGDYIMLMEIFMMEYNSH